MPQESAAKKPRATDSETSAILKIAKTIESVPVSSRRRVLDYIHARFCMTPDESGN